MDYNVISLLKTEFEFKQEPMDEQPHIYLHIQFNIPLSSSSVTPSTVSISNSIGDEIKTIVTYDNPANTIVIKFADDYVQNGEYYLTVMDSLQAVNKKKLPGKIMIRFNMKSRKPSGFVVLNGKEAFASKQQSTSVKDESVIGIINPETLPTKRANKLSLIKNYTKIIFGFLCAITLPLSYVLNSFTGYAIAAISVFLFVIYTYVHSVSGKSRAIAEYNTGVRYFNSRKYDKALAHFERSIKLNSNSLQTRKAIEVTFQEFLNHI